MNQDIRSLVRILAEAFDFPEPVWEIGSYCVAGQEEMADLRGLFGGKAYVGLDMRAGPGVDRVENVQGLKQADGTVGSILCLNTFEHVADFYAATREIYRVLRPGGMLVLTAPFDFVIHDHPHDYWRFTPQGLEHLTRAFGSRILGYQGYELMPHNTFAVAFKGDKDAELQEKIGAIRQRYREAVAGRRMSRSRRVRIAAARWLAGERFFRTRDHYTDVEMWVARRVP